MKRSMKLALVCVVAMAATTFTSCNNSKSELVTEYTVTVTSSAGGTATADKAKASAGKTVTLTATPADGYVFAGWTVAKGGKVAIATRAAADSVAIPGKPADNDIVFSPDTVANPARFRIPAADVGIEAVFAEKALYESGGWSGTFTYSGTSTWSSGSGATTLVLSGGKYTCAGNPNRIPAGGSGTYSIKGGKITFNVENAGTAETADFDWNLILNGEYDYTLDGKNLKLSKVSHGTSYQYDLVKAE